jgi:hypothetical protein
MLQFVLPLAAGFLGNMAGKSGAEAEAGEKLEAIKELVGLTPQQAQAVDAIKAQPIDEVRTRRTLGIGPLSPLPANANQRAQDIRNARIAAQSNVTPAEQAQIAASSDPAAAVKAVIDKKVNDLLASR